MNNTNEEVCHVCGSTEIVKRVKENVVTDTVPFHYSLCFTHSVLMGLFMRFIIENQSEITIKQMITQKPPRKAPIPAVPSLKDQVDKKRVQKPPASVSTTLKQFQSSPDAQKPPTPKGPPLSVRKDKLNLALELIKNITKYEDLSLEHILLVLNGIISDLIRASLKEE